MKDERLVQDAYVCEQQLAIVEKYEDVVNYLYPVIRSIDRGHAVARELFLRALLEQARLFIEAGKSSQVSKLYAADAGLAWLRFQLRFLAHPARRLITPKNHKVASEHLAEVGRLLGAWIKKAKEKKG
jgi:hypothetical protein